MADKCLIHFKSGENEHLSTFSVKSFQNFLFYRNSWLLLKGEQTDVAKKTIDLVSDKDLQQAYRYHYHRSCYSKFTNKTLLTRAQSRKRKVEDESNDNDDDQNCGANPPPKKLLRSSIPCTTLPSRNQHVLSPTCIICQKEKHTFYNRVSTLLLIIY